MLMATGPGSHQGRIEPPKGREGHAAYIDGKMLNVTKYGFQLYSRYVQCVILGPRFSLEWLRPVCIARLGEDLACILEIEGCRNVAYVELLLRAANV